MGKKRSHGPRRQNPKKGRSHAPPPLAVREIPPSKPPVEYGQPFTLLEDESKMTFEYKTGAWVPYELSIAECRQQSCQVKELPQKVNGRTRYEVRRPVDE